MKESKGQRKHKPLTSENKMAKSGVVEKRRVNVDAREFVKRWVEESRKEGGNYTAVANDLGLKVTSCYQRYQKLNAALKKAGQSVLPSLPETAAGRGRRQLDLSALAALINAPLHTDTGENQDELLDDAVNTLLD